MSKLSEYDKTIQHVFGEEKSRAIFEYMSDYPSPMQQMLEQVGRAAAEQYADTGEWPDPDQRVSVVIQDERPDFDWWEPRHDAPWRRQYHRDREAGYTPKWRD